MINKYLNLFIILIAAISIAGCAYFNTFYNANLFFDEAEHLREEKGNERLDRSTINKYKDVIEKCDIVLTKYPKSRYVDDAHFLKGKSQYYIGDYGAAEENFNNLLALDRDKYLVTADYWLALIKWKTGKSQPALNDLDSLLLNTEKAEQLAKIYESKANIYLDIGKDANAISSLEKAPTKVPLVERGIIIFELDLMTNPSGCPA